VHTGFWWGDLRERDHLEDLGVDRRMVLKLILNTWDGEVGAGLTWLRKGWWAVVNAVMNLKFRNMRGFS
jgi:hypothetical protein